MKKIISTMMLIVLCFSILLVGCGKTDETKQNDGTDDQTATDGTKKDEDTKKDELVFEDNDDPYELRWYLVGPPQKDLDQVMSKLSEYTKEKINATVKATQIDYGDYDQKMTVVVNSGEPFDICFTASWAIDYFINAQKGAYLPLNDLVQKYGKDMLNEIEPAFFEGITIDGDYYAIPTNKEIGWSNRWIFKQEFVDKYDIDTTKIKTLEDIEPYLKLIKENEPDIMPMKITKDFQFFTDYDQLIAKTPYSVNIYEDDGKIVNFYDTDQAKKVYETMRRFYQAGYMPKDVATLNNVNDLNNTGKWFVSYGSGMPYAEMEWSKQWGYPVASTPVHRTYVNNSSTSGSMMAVSVTSDNPARAVKFLNLLNTDKYVRNLVNFGIDGVHFDKIDENRIKIKQQGKEAYNMPTFALGNWYKLYLMENDPEDRYEALKDFNKEAVKSPALGFIINIDPIKNELAAIKNVVEQYRYPLWTGYVDYKTELPKFMEKLKNAGGDKVQQELQKQYDAFRASKGE